jgi:hypothetical protein
MPVISGNAISAAIQSATKGAVAPIRVRHSLILSILVWIVAYATDDDVEFGFTQSTHLGCALGHCDVLSSYPLQVNDNGHEASPCLTGARYRSEVFIL